VSQQPGPFNLGQSMNEALALHRQGRLREAEKIYTRVLKAAPDHFDALNLLGTIKAQLGRIGEAHRLLSAAVKLNPRAPQAWANLGQVLQALKQDQDALGCFDKALALAPDDIGILTNRANALLSLNRTEEALGAFRAILARVPQHPEARLNSGIAHAALGALDEAVAEFDRALELVPGHPAAHFNRGVALYDLGRYAEAVAAHDRALAAAPDHAGALLNRGRALAALNRFDDAIASYGKAHALRKDDADVHFMESLALLTLGDYRRGFEKYEWRWRRSGMPEQKSRGRPLWLGDYPLARKTVLLHAEQGFGDTIQFVRYVPLVARRGATVIVECQTELKNLLCDIPGAARLIARGEVLPAFDLHCPLLSLPLAFAGPSTLSASVPYLRPLAERTAKWRDRLPANGRLRVGVCWAGSGAHLNDGNRSIPLARFAVLFAVSGVDFVNLQKEVSAPDAAILHKHGVIQLGQEFADFADTAAVMAMLDLVISVDTSVAHLAGAMAKATAVLLPFSPDFRWMLDRTDSPWYPTMRLFRQASIGDWCGPLDRLSGELAAVASRRQPTTSC